MYHPRPCRNCTNSLQEYIDNINIRVTTKNSNYIKLYSLHGIHYTSPNNYVLYEEICMKNMGCTLYSIYIHINTHMCINVWHNNYELNVINNFTLIIINCANDGLTVIEINNYFNNKVFYFNNKII